MSAMLQMRKPDIAELKEAYEQKQLPLPCGDNALCADTTAVRVAEFDRPATRVHC